jgi:glycosyltransferase involved in cell wall biosynthesis
LAVPAAPDDALVSIVIPAFNAERTLEETAASALASSYPHIELIIVDDGSTDATAEIARSLAARDRRVRLVQRSNGGLPAALNTGFSEARADYVARLDADDVWHPDKLARQMALARRDPDAAFIYTFFRYIDEQGMVVRDGPAPRFPRRALARGIHETIIGTGSSVVLKRSAVAEVGGFNESWRTWEDLLMQLKVSARHPIAFVPEFLVGYRLRSDTLSQNMDEMASVWLQLDQHIRQLFPNVPRHVHDWGHARRCADIAESFAWRRQLGRSAQFLLKAARCDPAWTVRFLQFRISRHLKQRMAGRRPAPQPLRFADADPDKAMDVDPHGAPVVGGALARLEAKRMQRISRLDEQSADARLR